MLPDVPLEGFWYFMALAAAMVAWRLWGGKLVARVRQMDQQRLDADRQLLSDRRNPNAHFRQSVDQINEDTPPVEEIPESPGTFRWAGTIYPSRETAEAARWNHVLVEARSFYSDLDRSFGHRIAGRRDPGEGTSRET